MKDSEYPKYWMKDHGGGDKTYYKVYQHRFALIRDWDAAEYMPMVEIYVDTFLGKGVERCTAEKFNEVLGYLPLIPESVKQAIIDDNGE